MEALTKEQLNELQSLFNRLCRGDEATLGHREISQMLSGIGVKATAQELKEIIADVIGEDQQRVDFNAFVVLMTRYYHHLPFSDEIDSLFKEMDRTHDDILDAQDIINFLNSQDIYLSLEEAQKLLSLIGEKTSKGISKDTLMNFIQTKM